MLAWGFVRMGGFLESLLCLKFIKLWFVEVGVSWVEGLLGWSLLGGS